MKKVIKILITLLFLCVSINIHSQKSSKDNFEITYKRNTDNTIVFHYKKKLHGSYFVQLTFSELTNCFEPREFETVIKSSSGRLMTFRPSDKKKSISFSYRYSYIKGIPNPKINADIIYTLPFKKGSKIKISESVNLNEKYFEGETPKNWKSYIVDREASDIVRALRKGIVVKIENQFSPDTSLDYSYTSNMNSITIEHPDGTYASYKGFKKNSFFIKLGQHVYPNSKLGLLEQFNNDSFRLYFTVYYLVKENAEFYKNTSLTNQKSNFGYITPTFACRSGKYQLTNRGNYIVEFNEDLLMQEFSKKEKKNYKKNPTEFE